jgi:pimeloyl-ACP methyl ester carboxylesterase
VGRDWVSLRLSRVFGGHGVPRGSGEPVVVVPGFLGSDRYLAEFRHWLKRIGYVPYYSRIGTNADCLDSLMSRLQETVQQARSETGMPVRLIGHSLGGTLARTLAAHDPEHIAQVITLGSPIQAVRVHPMLLVAADVVRRRARNSDGRPDTCYTVGCSCAFVSSASETPPASVARAAIYTKTDGVVEWRCCLEDDDTLNIEVKGTHAGLAFNPQVYRAVAELLAGVKDNGHPENSTAGR